MSVILIWSYISAFELTRKANSKVLQLNPLVLVNHNHFIVYMYAWHMAFKYKLKGECLVIPTNLYDKKKNIVAIKC